MLKEHRFPCPYCAESISVVLDLSVDEQHYIEDCEVCCQPIDLSYRAEQSRVVDFRSWRGDE